MYTITYIHENTSTENTLYLPGDATYCLTAATLSLEVGAAGELSVSIPDTNPAKADFVCLTDEIIVYRDGAELWRGRAITRQEDFYRTGTLTCEGVLAYLYDTYYPPFTFSGSPTDFLQAVLDNHNAQVEERKQLLLGNVTVEDSNDYISRSSIEYNRTLTVLTDKLINDSLGGYFRVRIVDGVKYLDYLDSYGTTATQPVEFGVNLLDIAQNAAYSDLATVILPLGAKLEDSDGNQTDEYLTISDVNNGSIYYADEAAVEKYGWIVVCNIWEDVTEASNLLTKAKNYLAQVTSAVTSFEVNAVDLALVLAEYEYINLGDYVLIQSEPHGVDQYVELTAMDIDLLDPSNDTLTFGADTASLTDAQRSSDRAVQTALESLSVRYTNLVATAITTKYLAANYLNADTIRADYLTAKDIAANYASIDLANVSTANIGTLVANAGLLTNMSVVDGCVTGTLNGVTINADVITAGTLSVDRLLLTGEDGIIYAINASSSGLTESELSAEQYQNYINGSCIVANSVTAAQINVTDLFAQNITATGSITGLALYSVNGAFSLDPNGRLVSTSGQIGGWNIGTAKIYGGDEDTGVAVMQMPTSSTTYVFAAGGSSHSDYSDCPFRVSKTGKLYATKVEFSGGTVGGWNIGTAKIYGSASDGTTAVMQISGQEDDTSYIFACGGTSHSSYADCPFRVNKLGKMWANGLVSTASLVVANTYGIWHENTSGTAYRFERLDDSDNFLLGNINYPTHLYGSGGIYAKNTLYVGNTIRVPEIHHGVVTITPSAANTPTGKAVTFSTAFSGTPDVTLGAATAYPGTVVTGVGVSGPSSTGCTIYVTRTSTSDTSVRWIAAY